MNAISFNAVSRIITALAIGALAFAAPAAAITVKEVKSPIGVSAYLTEDHSTPVIAISFAFAGGSSLDPDNKLGLSDMAASLLDEGAGNLDSFAFQTALEDLAISIRFDSDRDMVRGQITATTPNIDRALELARLAMMQPRFDAEPVERARRQILVSMANRTENPGYIARKTLMETLFEGHPYAREEDGTPQTIAAITPDDLRGWVKSRFARDRLIVGASGDITADGLSKAMQTLFAGLPATTGLNAKLQPATVNAKGQTIRVAKNLPQSVVMLAHEGFLRSDPDWYTATVLDYIFGGGSFASRLMNEVREKRGLAYSVGTGLAPYDAAGLVTASVGTRADQADTSLSIIRDEWRKMRDAGPTAEELSAAKQYLTGAWPLRFTTNNSVAEILLAVQRDNLGIDYLDKRNSLIEGVTLEEAKRVAKRLYDPDTLTVVVVGPDLTAPAARPGAKPAAKPAS